MNRGGFRTSRATWSAWLIGGVLAAASAQLAPAGAADAAQAATTASAARADGDRVPVTFPPEVRRKTLAAMRMHLQGLAEVQQSLSSGDLEAAARIASMTLGMGSMHGDQAAQEMRYMPPGMRRLGARLHQQAGEFALAAQDAEATGDVRKPQLLLGQMMQTCVACHAAYRLR